MIQVIINGTSIDLISDKVKYTKQTNDLGDIAKINTSYTFALRVPITPKSRVLFKGLGLVSDTSDIPYVKNVTQLIDNGSVLIEKGISTVKETTKEYNLFIQDGIIDIFKLMENKTIGRDLDLSELVHSKNAESIIDTWGEQDPNIQYSLTEIPYRYLIADYNGKTNNLTGIDGAYQIPSVSIRYLWNKVFDYLGYTFSGNMDFINNKYLTYPKPPEIEEVESTLSLHALKGSYNGAYNDSYKQWSVLAPYPITDVIMVNNWKVRVNQTGSYRIKFYGAGTMVYAIGMGLLYTNIFRINLFVEGVFKSYVLSNTSFETDVFFDVNLQAENEIELTITPLTGEEFQINNNFIRNAIETKNYTITNLYIEGMALEVYNTGRENIDFQNALSDFSIKDFFKEIMFRGALTAYVDNITQHIELKSLKEQLKVINSEVVDLSKKYVNREKETYTFGTYAQKNILTLKYNDLEDNYFNGSIAVVNKNLPDEKKLFESRFYAPSQNEVDITLTETENTLKVPLVKLWDKENKEDKDGIQTIEYKPLNNRFYLLSAEVVNQDINVNGVSATKFYKASIKGTTMQEVVQSRYADIHKIFTDTRIHEINLALSAYDFFSIDLRKLYYFQQEGQFYIINRLIWETGKISKGEFLRVKKV